MKFKPTHLLLLLGVVVAGCQKGAATDGGGDDATDAVVAVQTTTVAVRDIRDTAVLDGAYSFAPGDFAKLAPATAGRLTAVFVQQGDRVTRGQLLARVDLSVLAAQQSSAQLGAQATNRQAAQAATELKAVQSDVASQIRTAEINLQTATIERATDVASAKTDLDKLLAGARPQEIAQAELTVNQARVDRDKAKREADRDAALSKEGYVSGQQADASRSAYEVAQSALSQAQQQLDLLKSGARKEDILAARLRLASAKLLGDKKVEAATAALAQAKQGSLTVDAKRAEASAAQLAAGQKSADALAAAKTLGYGEIRAPYDGVVVRRLQNEGDSADPSSPVLEVVRQGAHVEFMGSAFSAVANKLAEGMDAIEVDGAAVVGRVRSVGVADPQTGQSPVRIVLTTPPNEARPGAFGRLAVVVKVLKSCAAVPDDCISDRDGKTYVFAVSDGVAHIHEVKTGPSDRGLTALLSGAKPKEAIVDIGQHEMSDGAKVKVAEERPAK